MDEDTMVLSKDVLDAGRSRNGGWGHDQLRVIDVMPQGPNPPGGWKRSVTGRVFPATAIREFLRLKDAHLGHSPSQEMPTVPVVAPATIPGPLRSSPVADIYCDGGLIGPNPSPSGGTWGWVHVGPDGVEVARGSGYFEVHQFDDLPGRVGNNAAELVAAVLALECLPDGWSGRVFTDSKVTVYRLRGSTAMAGVPAVVVTSLRKVLRRLGRLRVVLLSGHPSPSDLEHGIGRSGRPVSKFNVICDRMCHHQSSMFLRGRRHQGVNT